jgi:hypothetical protein
MTENTANYGSEKKDGGYEFGGPVGIESWLYLYLAKVKDFKKSNLLHFGFSLVITLRLFRFRSLNDLVSLHPSLLLVLFGSQSRTNADPTVR